uniref:Uncharacterized protein n=1 Tax=Anguilla anguilla TaxID=7936 RepID=A0A0E9XUU7_ANGAN
MRKQRFHNSFSVAYLNIVFEF